MLSLLVNLVDSKAKGYQSSAEGWVNATHRGALCHISDYIFFVAMEEDVQYYLKNIPDT